MTLMSVTWNEVFNSNFSRETPWDDQFDCTAVLSDGSGDGGG
jgi:hypothetical protein